MTSTYSGSISCFYLPLSPPPLQYGAGTWVLALDTPFLLSCTVRRGEAKRTRWWRDALPGWRMETRVFCALPLLSGLAMSPVKPAFRCLQSRQTRTNASQHTTCEVDLIANRISRATAQLLDCSKMKKYLIQLVCVCLSSKKSCISSSETWAFIAERQPAGLHACRPTGARLNASSWHGDGRGMCHAQLTPGAWRYHLMSLG